MSDLPPPDPATASSPVGQRDPAAQYADGVAAWVGRRHVAVKVLLWVGFWWVLAALALVRRTNGSAAGMGGAIAIASVGGLLMLGLVIGDAATEPAGTPEGEAAAPAQSPTDAATTAEDLSPTPDATDGPSASPAPTRSESPSPHSRSARATAPPSPSAEPTSAPGPTPTARQAALVSPRGDDAPIVRQTTVTSITDGDTFDLADGTTIRIAIVDTPEAGEPCGSEATSFTRSFVAGEEVAIVRPTDAPARGGFGRLLGEVIRVRDGASLNVALVAAGLGTIDERYADEDPDLTTRLRSAARNANAASCTGAVDTAPQPEQDPEPGPTQASGPHTGRTGGGWGCHPAYQECLPNGPDLDCADVGHAVRLLGNDDPYRLDGNSTTRSDGVGCESYPPWSASADYPYY